MFNEQDINEQTINPNEKERVMEMKKLKGMYSEALKANDLNEALSKLIDIHSMLANHPNQEDWFDQNSRFLFQAFYKEQNWKGAKAVVEMTNKPGSQEGRKARLEDLSGMSYEEI